MYILNKIVGTILNPHALSLLVGIIAIGIYPFGKARKTCLAFTLIAVLNLWFWSLPITYRWLGGDLEKEYPVLPLSQIPTADAIVVLGGGMGANTNAHPYAEMWASADRVWHAARLYKAGKAPIVIPTGTGDHEAVVPLLRDLGVPLEAIQGEYEARNTEENAKFVEKLLLESSTATNAPHSNPPKVLLVTSAWHMRRAEFMYRRYAPKLDVIPVATDYEAVVKTFHPTAFSDFIPTADALMSNCYIFKEYLGFWGYRLFRR